MNVYLLRQPPQANNMTIEKSGEAAYTAKLDEAMKVRSDAVRRLSVSRPPMYSMLGVDLAMPYDMIFVMKVWKQ